MQPSQLFFVSFRMRLIRRSLSNLTREEVPVDWHHTLETLETPQIGMCRERRSLTVAGAVFQILNSILQYF